MTHPAAVLYDIPEAERDPLIDGDAYHAMYRQSIEHPEAFFAAQAETFLTWEKKWETVRDVSFAQDDVHISWFAGGELNVAANCIDRHLAERGDKTAIIWEPDDPQEPAQHITYRALHQKVCRCANMLKELGVRQGDRVTIYMPMVPEAAIAMLACARIGAIHSVVFGGFSPQALRGRIEDCASRVVITADEGVRGNKTIPLKASVDTACEGTDVEKVLVFRRTGNDVAWEEGRDVWWHTLESQVSDDCPAPAFEAETPLFVLYTSGSTGKPKGLMHTSAGYLLWAAMTYRYVFDHHEEDIFWCTADVGWVTGHSYILYGPLACGATTLMFEGVPNYPDASRFWQVVDKHNVTLFYTAPTAIRMLMREGEAFVERTDRSTLRVLGSVGEPINPEAWRWYHEVVGDKRCAIVDTWWQTETGGHLLTPLPGAIKAKPGSATLPFFGVQPALLDPQSGQEVTGTEAEGALCMKGSWPGQARSIWGNHARFVETYFSTFPGYYFSGDAARRDEDGYYWIEGRMDDVLNVSGHRLGTAEIESALVAHEAVTEAAVVGYPHEVKGEDIYAYVTCKPDIEENDTLRDELRQLVRHEIGPIAQPGKLHFTPGLPKTRSGKIMRRILRKIAAGEITSEADYGKLGDTSTLLNPDIVDALVTGRL